MKTDIPHARKHEALPGLISVIMPCFNGEKYLREAIESVRQQTYPYVELIVVDDGSTDGSRDILREYGEQVVFLEQKNQGPYPARNLGIQASRGEFIAFLDADDYWRPDCLELLHKALAGSNAAAAYCGWQNIGLPGGRGAPYVPPDYEAGNKAEQFLRAAAPWPIHAALVRRSVLDEVGSFDLQWPTCMDYDLWLRIGFSRPIVRVEEVLAFYRHHNEGQITSKQWRQARNSWLVKKKFVESNPAAVAGIPSARLKELIDGGLLRRGYDAYWKRDLVSAQKIFRMALRAGGWGLKDMKYLLPALLPEKLYQSLIGKSDHRKESA